MEELLVKMASLLQEIYDEGHGGEFRGSINQVLVQYNAAQPLRALDKVLVRLGDACPECGSCDVQCAECLAALCQ